MTSNLNSRFGDPKDPEVRMAASKWGVVFKGGMWRYAGTVEIAREQGKLNAEIKAKELK